MVYLSPVGASTTTDSLPLLVTFKERLCRSVCATSTNLPESIVTYNTGTPVLNDGTLFIPIIATVTIVTPGCSCAATTQVKTERFIVAFLDLTTIPTTVTVTQSGKYLELANVNCGKSNWLAINNSIVVAITAA